MTVVDVQALLEVVDAVDRVVDEADAVVGLALGNGVGQLAARRGRAVQDVDQRVARLLAGKPGPDDRPDARVRENGFEDDRADAMHHDHDVGIDRRDSGDELVPVVPRIQVVAIALVAFDHEIFLAAVGANEDHGHGGVLGNRDRIARRIVHSGRDDSAVDLSLLLDRIQWANQVGKFGSSCQALELMVEKSYQ